MVALKKSTVLTEAGQVSNAAISQTEKGMAHFAGTAENGKQCRHCPHWQAKSIKPTPKTKRYCKQYIRLTGDEKKAISGAASACRYFFEEIT